MSILEITLTYIVVYISGSLFSAHAELRSRLSSRINLNLSKNVVIRPATQPRTNLRLRSFVQIRGGLSLLSSCVVESGGPLDFEEVGKATWSELGLDALSNGSFRGLVLFNYATRDVGKASVAELPRNDVLRLSVSLSPS